MDIQREASICKFNLIKLALSNKIDDEINGIEFKEKFILSNKLMKRNEQLYNKEDIITLTEIQNFIDKMNAPKKTR